MKRLCIFVLALSLLFTLCGCKNDPIEPSAPVQTEELLNSNYSAEPFLTETGFCADDKWVQDAVSNVPSDKYEAYPSLQNVPLSASLYKNEVLTPIDVNDPRVIALVNFFNNALHNDKCYYQLSFLSMGDVLDEVLGQDIVLILKYTPYGDVYPSQYENNPTAFDTIIINSSSFDFTLINSESKVRSDDKLVSPVLAVKYIPFGLSGNSLGLFGF